MKRSLGVTAAVVTLYWPDEVFAEILPHIYEGRIHTMADLARLISLCRVSSQFKRVLWASVTSSIRYIASVVLEKKGPVMLAYFPGVDELQMTSRLFVRKELYDLLPSLMKLSFTEDCRYVRGELPPGWLTSLESLAPSPMFIENAILSRMSQLKCLDLRHDIRLGRDEAISSLVSLRVLLLNADSGVKDSTLALLSSLHTLGLRGSRTVTDAGLLALGGRLTSLDLRHNEVITGGCLTQMTRLRTLCLRDNDRIRDRHLVQMTGLTSLNLNDNAEISLASLTRLTSLRTLSFSYLWGPPGNGLRPLTNLESLEQKMWGPFSNLKAMKSMRRLRHLLVHTEEQIGVDFVRARPYLTSLVVPVKKLVTQGAREILKGRGGQVERIDQFVRVG
jgi:hypothetical protein